MSFHYGKTWCSNRDCPCGKPGRPCHEWMGWKPFRYCPRCGWEKSDHKPLIRNGGKP